jgi:tetratricopeptide (TPR) repeat protein
MKPKIFIGSSTEGLSVAYAVQNNLYHDSEPIVWNQGVFELSDTTIESLIDISNTSDFGIFVFSPDDITKMREKKENTVRDNVIFELGLFIGKVGRKRTFILIPEKAKLHIPSDLLGITPGRFKADRQDNLEAATGPFCNQVRQQIKKVGLLHTKSESVADATNKDVIEKADELPHTPSEENWAGYFIDKDYAQAIKALDISIANEKDEEKKAILTGWKLYNQALKEKGILPNYFDDLLEYNQSNSPIYLLIARFLFWEDYFDDALIIVEKALSQFNSFELILLKVSILKKSGKVQEALQMLDTHKFDDESVAVALIEEYEQEKNLQRAREIVHNVYLRRPNSEKICFKYAMIALDLEEKEVAIFLFNKLKVEYPGNSDYWGYLSNACVLAGFPDLGLKFVKKANQMTSSKEAWLLGNMGNIYKNQKLPTEAIEYLRASIEILNEYGYAHERLASAIKLQEEEIKKFEEYVNTGRNKLRSFKVEHRSEESVE